MTPWNCSKKILCNFSVIPNYKKKRGHSLLATLIKGRCALQLSHASNCYPVFRIWDSPGFLVVFLRNVGLCVCVKLVFENIQYSVSRSPPLSIAVVPFSCFFNHYNCQRYHHLHVIQFNTTGESFMHVLYFIFGIHINYGVFVYVSLWVFVSVFVCLYRHRYNFMKAFQAIQLFL